MMDKSHNKDATIIIVIATPIGVTLNGVVMSLCISLKSKMEAMIGTVITNTKRIVRNHKGQPFRASKISGKNVFAELSIGISFYA